MRNREKVALGLFIFGAIFWFAETWYFGWNLTAQSPQEGFCDFLVWVFWGLAFFIRPTRVENTIYQVKKGSFRIYTSKVSLSQKEGEL